MKRADPVPTGVSAIIIISFLILFAAVNLPGAGELAAQPAPGSDEDPLITRSWLELYLEGDYNHLASQVEELAAKTSALEKKIAALRAGTLLKVVLTIGRTTAYIGDQARVLDVAPFITPAGRTMLPFRFMGEALGAQVDWNPVNRSVAYRLGTRNVTLWIGKSSAAVNGREVRLEAPPQIVNNRTVVPLRAVGELLGSRVDWDGAARTVTIYP